MVIDRAIDEALGVHALFISLPRRHAVFVKVLLESYEGLAVVRSVEPRYSPGRLLQVVLVAPDLRLTTERVLSSIESDTEMQQVRPPEQVLEQLRRDLLDELDEPGGVGHDSSSSVDGATT